MPLAGDDGRSPEEMDLEQALKSLADILEIPPVVPHQFSPTERALAAVNMACGKLLGKDNCEVCHGEKGGVKGNENIVDGKIMCDYCTVEHLEKQATEGESGRSQSPL